MDEGTGQSTRPSWLRAVLIGRNPRFTLIRIAVAVAVVFLLRAYVILPIKVSGPSMMPTYQEHGVNFVNRLAYWHSEPKRGDVVAIQLAGPHVMYMKRVVGLPGETVAFRDGTLLINGKPMDEPYEKWPSDWDRAPVKLGPTKYFVVGDNRSMPEQFHVFGEADRKKILGKIILCRNIFASWVH